MQMRRIGSLEVSVVGLGCNNFGKRLDQDATTAVIDAALDAGVTLFDTADIYGDAKSEVMLGKALGTRRERIVLATKFGAPIAGAPAGASAAYIATAVEASLRRLGTDRIDLYQLHLPDPTVPLEETIGALEALVAAGKVREIGCSNFTVPMLREARGRFACVQNELSLLHPDADVLAECAATGVAYLPYFPLASGALTGKYLADPAAAGRLAGGGALAAAYLSAANVTRTRALDAFARDRGHSLTELAFAWLLTHGPVASVIAGATTAAQIRANVAAATAWPQLADDAAAMTELAALLAA